MTNLKTMLPKLSKLILPCLLLTLCTMCTSKQSVTMNDSRKEDYVTIKKNDSVDKVDVFIGGKYFTSYLYADPILRKPVLFPLFTASGKRITRGFPIDPNTGERIDHPHHYGLWLNHGDVNGIDFWNSAVIPKNPKARYGSINHIKFLKETSGKTGTLEVEKEWRTDNKELIIKEHTRYDFSGDANKRCITLTTTLTAPNSDVKFKDSKEGMLGLRMCEALEIPANNQPTLYNIPKNTMYKSKASGQYLNSNGLNSYPEVWGKRANWMELSGVINDESVSVCIFDYPKNINHPPHWMARDYGLFGVNPFGSSAYTEGKEQLNYTLKKGESITFKHQIVIRDGVPLKPENIEVLYKDFVGEN